MLPNGLFGKEQYAQTYWNQELSVDFCDQIVAME